MSEILRTLAGRQHGFHVSGYPIWNLQDGSQMTLQVNSDGYPFFVNTTTSGDQVETQLGVAGNADWDIEFYLTTAEIEDSRLSTGPTINLTTKINAAIQSLRDKYLASPSTSNMRAGRGAKLVFRATYLIDYLNVYPGMFLEGDSRTETILIQAPTATTDFITVLARNGKTARMRTPWAQLSNMTLQGTKTLFGPGTVPLHGITCAPASSDPDYVGGLDYNSYVLRDIRSYNFSGDGFHAVDSRKRPWYYDCRASGCGGNGFYQGDCADAFYLECASGSNDGHSVKVVKGDTPRFIGGDYWASNNASETLPDPDGSQRAFYIDRVQEGIVLGPDINAAVEFLGENTPGAPYYQTTFKWKWRDINFKFRDSSHGDGDSSGGDGTPDPLSGYIITKNARGVSSAGCTFQPSFDRTTQLATVRPAVLYSILGDSVHYANDILPDITSGIWPAGATLGTNSYDTITDAWSKLALQAQISDLTNGFHGTLFNSIRFIEGHTSGIVGQTDAVLPQAGTVGERKTDTRSSSGAVTLVSNTIANIASLALTPGEWDVHAFSIFTGAAGTGTKMELGLSSASTTLVKTSAAEYAVNAIPWTTLTTDIARLQCGPSRQASTASVTLYANVQCTFSTSAGSMTAFGGMNARRVG